MAHKLADARKHAGLTQQQLGKLIDRDRVTVARIESGKYTPSFGTITKIVAVFRAKSIALSADDFIRSSEEAA